MIYLDTSVILAHLLAEDQPPPAELWRESLITSRLTEYEVWNRIHARALSHSHAALVQECFGRLNLLDLTADVLSRALEPFPMPLRTLEALHLASLEFLRGRGCRPLQLATFDPHLAGAAEALKFEIYPLS